MVSKSFPQCSRISPLLFNIFIRRLPQHRISSTLVYSERIDYKLLSLTYKVLTTTQPPYLHKLISVQRPRSTRSSSLVTLAHPPASSSLRITDCSFQYASPHLWNQLPISLRQPRASLNDSDTPHPTSVSSSSSMDSPVSPFILPHSSTLGSKPTFSRNHSHHRLSTIDPQD